MTTLKLKILVLGYSDTSATSFRQTVCGFRPAEDMASTGVKLSLLEHGQEIQIYFWNGANKKKLPHPFQDYYLGANAVVVFLSEDEIPKKFDHNIPILLLKENGHNQDSETILRWVIRNVSPNISIAAASSTL